MSQRKDVDKSVGKDWDKIESHLDWSSTLKALADENRIKIISELMKSESTVQDLADVLNLKVYNISKHLKILETNGLVEKRKEGIHRIFFISDKLRSQLSDNNEVLDLGCCKFFFRDK